MRNRESAFRARVLGQVAFVTVIAGMAASCSNSTRLQEPFFTGSTENQREIIGQNDTQPMPGPISGGSMAVSRSDLPPPPAVAYADPTPMAPQPTYAEGSYGWSAVGGQVTSIRAGETLDTLASKYGVPPEQILSANQLRGPADIKAGKVIVIPHRVAMTPEAVAAQQKQVAAAYEPPVAPAAGATSYTVANGDTLYSISRRYGVKVADIAAANGLKPDSAVTIGQTLRLPGNGHPAAAVAAAQPPAPQPVRVASIDPKVKLPTPADTVAPPMGSAANGPAIPAVPTAPVAKGTQDPAAASAAIDQAADSGSASGTEFRWPVRGRIIAGFGAKPNGEKNDGINLAVPEGTAVKAAEAGTVIYAGNELEGYGNLILVRHADGWVSAYANNRDINVKRGDTVRRGQTIAHAGMTGSVSSPQVHFELRKGAKPVNPLDYLAT
jgi:murein DD-endopeptidase MepM/ murein hydrolase activator NlpD